MPPFSLHAAFGHYELALAFGRSSDDASDAPEADEAVVELMPVLSEADRDMFGFRRFDRPEVY